MVSYLGPVILLRIQFAFVVIFHFIVTTFTIAPATICGFTVPTPQKCDYFFYKGGADRPLILKMLAKVLQSFGS